jgi:hypothetical protein
MDSNYEHVDGLCFCAEKFNYLLSKGVFHSLNRALVDKISFFGHRLIQFSVETELVL